VGLLEDIRKTFQDIKVLVVANKADLLDEMKMNVIREFDKGVIFVSAATGKGVPDLKKFVIELLGSIPH
jgi:50S ribosomal subunit-associated GTPase HflX